MDTRANGPHYGLNSNEIEKNQMKFQQMKLKTILKTKFKFGIIEKNQMKLKIKFKLRPKYSSTCILNYPSLLTL